MNYGIDTLDCLPLHQEGTIEHLNCKRKYKKKTIRFRLSKGGFHYPYFNESFFWLKGI